MAAEGSFGGIFGKNAKLGGDAAPSQASGGASVGGAPIGSGYGGNNFVVNEKDETYQTIAKYAFIGAGIIAATYLIKLK